MSVYPSIHTSIYTGVGRPRGAEVRDGVGGRPEGQGGEGCRGGHEAGGRRRRRGEAEGA